MPQRMTRIEKKVAKVCYDQDSIFLYPGTKDIEQLLKAEHRLLARKIRALGAKRNPGQTRCVEEACADGGYMQALEDILALIKELGR